MQAVVYARYSSDKQNEDSIEAQRRACSAYAAVNGFTVVGEYVDEAISGKGAKTAARVAYQRMIRDSGKGLFDAILIHKYDRVARNLGDHVNLERRLSENKVALVAVAQDFGTSNEAKIMRSIVWAMSEYYIDNLSDEVKKGHKENALKALHNGGCPPFGYDVVDKQYVINDLEAGYVKKIFQCAANREGFVKILDEMDAAGIKGKRGKPVKYSQVHEMLRNEKYTGVYLYNPRAPSNRTERHLRPNAIRIDGALPAIIERPIFEEVQKIVNERKQVGNKANYLCGGLVYCKCGAKMHGIAPRRHGHQYFYYYCSKKCGCPNVKMQDVDSAVMNYLHTLLSTPSKEKIIAALREYQSNKNDRLEAFYGALKQKINEKQKKHDALLANLSTGELPAPVVKKIGQEMQVLQEEIETLRNTVPPEDFTKDMITAWLESLKVTPDDKAVRLLVERIDVDVNEKTDFNITSTLKSVLGETGWGSRI